MGIMPTLAGAVLGSLIRYCMLPQWPFFKLLLYSFPFALLIDGLGRIFIGSEEKQRAREQLFQARREREKQW